MRIATIVGSLRQNSYNRALCAIATEILQRHHAEVDSIDLKQIELPIYDADIEASIGLPDAAWKLKARLAACHGILIVSPEYNGGVPGGLKNAIDWSSRGEGNSWQGKAVAIMGASTGQWGATRMMPHLRQTMTILGAQVIPDQINVPHASKVWSEGGALLDEKLVERVEKVITRFLDLTQRLAHERLKSPE